MPLLAAQASCGEPATHKVGGKFVDSTSAPGAPEAATRPFAMEEIAHFDEPWSLAFEPGTGNLFVTGKKGGILFVRPDRTIGRVEGGPRVDYGGQGGLGDFAFGPDYARDGLVYLSWAEAGPGDVRGAAVGRARLACEPGGDCALRGLEVIWRQDPKVTGRGHYSHRIAFSPDGRYLFVSSGDRQKGAPAQDTSNTLGTIVRLLPDGTPAPGNPLAARGGAAAQVWSWGHRNVLGLAFDAQGRLWAVEHGPRGGDELNLVRRGANYGWPEVSNGMHYDGESIPDHAGRREFAAPATSWTPVIAPGDMIFYDGDAFPSWRGQALIAGLKSQALVRVAIEGDSAREVARYPMERRVRSVAQAPDGALWFVEDRARARLFRLTPHR